MRCVRRQVQHEQESSAMVATACHIFEKLSGGPVFGQDQHMVKLQVSSSSDTLHQVCDGAARSA